MNITTLNMTTNKIPLNVVFLNVVGAENLVRKTRYVPDDKIPDTHTGFVGADGEELFGSDNHKFYCKTE